MSSIKPLTYVKGFHNDSAVERMKYNKLGETGMLVSVLGIGGVSFGDEYGKIDLAEASSMLHYSIKSGINYIDTAPYYGAGRSEEVLGKALKGIPREAYYIATKVGRYGKDLATMFDFSSERTLKSVDESLEKLGLDYVDIIQVHDMEFASDLKIILNETLPALEKVVKSGKARFIGITGYPLNNFRKVLEQSTVKISTLITYAHYCLFNDSAKDEFDFYKKHSVGIINASPNGLGLLSYHGPQSWHVAQDNIKLACKEAVQYCQTNGFDISKLAVGFSCCQKDIAITLVSNTSLSMCERNLKTAVDGLTSQEVDFMEKLRKRFFDVLPERGWEGIEVEAYWKAVRQC